MNTALPIQVPPKVEITKPIRRTVTLLVLRMVILLFLVDSLYAALLVMNASGFISSDWSASYATFLWLAFTAKFIVLAFLLTKLVVDWMSTVYYVSGGHLIRQRGVMNLVETVFQLTDIDSVVMNQSWLGRLLNYGTVTVEFTVARDKEYVRLYAITNPQLYEDIFSQFV
jgi:uncharacterized membrane protein YdbT with pleckstrin-like domain